MNVCTECGEDFFSVDAFDEHRTGVHDYDYSEGVRQDPPVEDGRRCFVVAELVEFGWFKDGSARWHYPKDWARQSWKWDHVA